MRKVHRLKAEKIYTCEAKIPFFDKLTGRKIFKWIEKPVIYVSEHNLIRCKECHGSVRRHRNQITHGPADHVEHLSGEASVNNCKLGSRFSGTHAMAKNRVI